MIGPLSLAHQFRLTRFGGDHVEFLFDGGGWPKKPPTTSGKLAIFTSFLAYQTYSVAREKTSKATEVRIFMKFHPTKVSF